MRQSNAFPFFCLVWICIGLAFPGLVYSQVSEKEIAALEGEASANRASSGGAKVSSKDGMDVLSLLERGGIFMIPIGIVSRLVLTFVIDRGIGLRAGKLFPGRFRKSIQQFSKQLDADPRMVYQSCLEHPSAAANVVKSMLLTIGRPIPEVKASIADSLQREADQAYSNVRWLNLAAGIAPLLGLLGTVWGLIRAFHDTTQLQAGQNRADFLAVGIYEALVTTLAGLLVAIPAAVASHYFEGRVTRVFGSIDESLSELLPRFEHFEGRNRFEVIGREIAPRELVAGKSSTVLAPPVSR